MEVYLDNSATTRCYESVRELVGKVMCEDYGNPSSMHKKGVEAEKYVRESKETLAKLLKVQEKEIFFTSGGTESDNLALIGCAKANCRAGRHLITTTVEHPAILNTMQHLLFRFIYKLNAYETTKKASLSTCFSWLPR